MTFLVELGDDLSVACSLEVGDHVGGANDEASVYRAFRVRKR